MTLEDRIDKLEGQITFLYEILFPEPKEKDDLNCTHSNGQTCYNIGGTNDAPVLYDMEGAL